MDIKIIDFNRGDNDVENKTRILYNDTVDQWKGCSAAWQRVCFGYKMSRVQILSSLPITAPLSSNEGFFEINSHWTYHIESFIVMILYSVCIQDVLGPILFFTVLFFMIRKRSQFSSVERGSPKPDVVGSNPTERDSDLLRSNSAEARTGTAI